MIASMTAMDAAYLASRVTEQNKQEMLNLGGLADAEMIAGWLINAIGVKIVCLTKKKVPVLIAGLTLDGHIGQTFMVVGEEAGNRHWVEISRAIVQITDAMLQDDKELKRIELLCLKSNPAVDAGWYEKLGFKLESVMQKKAKDGSDCCMFVKFKES